jgi:hypothetical protein
MMRYFIFSTLDITAVQDSNIQRNDYLTLIKNNGTKIQQYYSWQHIKDLPEKSLTDALLKNGK